MSAGGPNIRVGLDVEIFGTKQLAKAQAALSALGLKIQDIQASTVSVNGTQNTYIKGLVELTAKSQKARAAQAAAADAAIRKATANAKVSASVTKTVKATKQANAQLKQLQRAQQAAAKAAQQLAHHQAKVNATLAARMQAQNNQAALNQATANLKQRNALALQMQKAMQQGNNQAHQVQMANIRHQNALALQNIRHQNALLRQQQRDQFQPIGALGSVGRVIAYDMLRRMITNMYQGFFRIAETLGDWVTQSVMFNDEIERAKTVFQGIGMIGTKNAAGQPMTIPEAEISTDPKVRAVLMQSQKNSEDMIRGLMEISAMTGSDMDEVISSARQLLPDLINKRAKAGMPNPYLEKPEEFNAITQQMVKLASVLKMSDPGGRPLKWHMVAIQEMFSGTSGGGKDKGKEAVRSLRAREGIRVDDKSAAELAQAVNAGELSKAAQIVTDILERSGQGVQNLSNLMGKTLMPNIDGTITALRIFGIDFVDLFHKDLISTFTTIRVMLFKILNLESYKETMRKLSTLFKDQFGDITDTVLEYLQKIYDDPSKLYASLEGPIKNLGSALKAVRSVIEGIALFSAGLVGTELAYDSITKSAENFKNNAYDLGVESANTVNQIITLISEITSLSSELNLILGPLRAFNTGIAAIFEMLNQYFTFFYTKVPGYKLIGDLLGLEAGEGGVFGEFGKSIKKYLYERTGYIDYNALPGATAGMGQPDSGTASPSEQAATRASNIPPALAAIQRAKNLPQMPNGAPYVPPGQIPNLFDINIPEYSGQTKGPIQINPKIESKDVIEGFKNIKPISFQPKSVGVNLSFNIGQMNVTANDAKEFASDVMSGTLDLTNKPVPLKVATPSSPVAGFSASLGLNY